MIHTRLKECSAEPRLLCSVDPITLTGLALGIGAAGATAAASSGGSSPAPSPTPPPAAPPPAQSPQGKALPKPQQQSFIGAAATPPTQSGQKTLLGQ